MQEISDYACVWVIKNKRKKKKRSEIKCQLVSVKWKIKSSPEKNGTQRSGQEG